MPVWTVQLADGGQQWVEAALLATDGGALFALSEESLMVQTWMPGHWRTVRYIAGAAPHLAGGSSENDAVLIGLPRDARTSADAWGDPRVRASSDVKPEAAPVIRVPRP